MAPLEIAARLVSEDINILKKGADGGAHHLYVPTIQQGRGRYQSFADPYQHSQRDALPSRMDGARPHRVASLTAAWHGPALGGEDRVFGRTVPCTPREHILCLMATDAFSGSSPESRPRSRWSVPLSLSRWSGLDNPLSTSCVSSKRTGLLIRGWCKPVTSSSVVRGRLSGGCRSLMPWSLAWRRQSHRSKGWGTRISWALLKRSAAGRVKSLFIRAEMFGDNARWSFASRSSPKVASKDFWNNNVR